MSSLSRRKLFMLAAPLALIPVLALTGCGGGGSGGSGGPGTGTLRVSLVDAPDPTISSLNITIDRVEAHVVNPNDLNDNEPGHWQTITTSPQTFDLLDLVTNEAILGSATLPTGHYTQVRLFVSNATVTDATGTHPVTIPSAGNTGIKLNVDYTISPNQITAILLDFNVNKSLIKQGNGQYRLQPVIPAVVKVLSGTITGTVTQNGAPVDGAEVKAVYVAGGKYTVGTEVNSTVTQDNGTFKIWALLPGTYNLTVTTPGGATTTQNGVIVTANQNISVGTITVP
jgi:hypothetical protein